MRLWVAVAALLVLGGCAALRGEPPTPPAAPSENPSAPLTAETVAPAPGSMAATLGVRVVIEAPDDLRALLERHLDLVRLGQFASAEVADTEWSRLVDATPAQARELLQTEGYFAPRIAIAREPASTPGEPDTVRLTVTPGPATRVSRVTVQAEGDLERAATAGDAQAVATLAELRKRWALPAGARFRNADWSAAKAGALARLRAAGYATAVWSGTGAEVDPDADTVRLFVVADSGPLFRYGELQIDGLVVHDADTVRNLVAAPAGAPVTETLLLDFQDRLQKSGLFEGVSVTLDTDPAQAAHARIVARVRESALQVYTFGIGISANVGPRASLEHTWRRVFGQPVSARNKFEWGAKRKAWDGEISTHTQPNLYRYLVGGAVEQLQSDTDTVLSQRVRTGRAQDTERIDRLTYVEYERSTRRTVDLLVNTKAIATSLNFRGVRRELDDVLLPTRGYSLSGQVGVGYSHGKNAEPGPFERVFGRVTAYVPLGNQWQLTGRVEAGKVFLRANGVVPESQQFRAGGDDSVRGYAYRSLGPIVDGAVGSGNALYTSSVEIAHPIAASLPSVWGAAFIDAGNAGNGFRGLDPAVGYGVGVRWRSPLGPLRLDWAYGRQVRKSRIHFSVGITF